MSEHIFLLFNNCVLTYGVDLLVQHIFSFVLHSFLFFCHAYLRIQIRI